MNINEFISELTKRCKSKGLRVNQNDMKTIVTEFISLIKDKVFDGCEVRLKNFAIFTLGMQDKRKLPNGEYFEQNEIIKVRLSDNFKRKR